MPHCTGCAAGGVSVEVQPLQCGTTVSHGRGSVCGVRVHVDGEYTVFMRSSNFLGMLYQQSGVYICILPASEAIFLSMFLIIFTFWSRTAAKVRRYLNTLILVYSFALSNARH